MDVGPSVEKPVDGDTEMIIDFDYQEGAYRRMASYQTYRLS